MKLKATLAVVIFLVTGLLFFSVEAAPKANFDSVADGMTETEILALLGKPLGISQDNPDTKVYFYGGFPKLRWCSIEVFFGPEGKVKGKFHDH
jgi:hypothetical protein